MPVMDDYNLNWALRAHRYHCPVVSVLGLTSTIYIFPFEAQPWREVKVRNENWPSAVRTAHVSERIHAIRTQTYPHVSGVGSKVFVLSIDIPPLNRIRRVS